MGYADTRAYKELIIEMEKLGQPRALSEELAKNLYSEKMISRMVEYLRCVRPRSAEIIVDEMLALMADREAWISKMLSEEANAKYTEYLNQK